MKLIGVVSIALMLLFGCSKNNGVVTKGSGLKYKDDTTGTGKIAEKGDLVTFHFKGWIVGDSSNLFTDWSGNKDMQKYSIGDSRMYKRPVVYVLGSESLMNGLDEGIEGMKVGGTRTIILPAKVSKRKVAYGPIPPNADLKFVVNLIDAKTAPVVKEWDVDSTKLVTTKSGLKYAIVEKGTGDKIKDGDTVTVDYSGYLLDGKKFDSSVEREEPFTFVVGQRGVIIGWDEGITYLNKGAKARFVIPPDLGYGPRPMGKIPPNSTLVFDVHVLDVK
jgi:FKBP-type peptidyl-prolyl cis-trans isomerase